MSSRTCHVDSRIKSAENSRGFSKKVRCVYHPDHAAKGQSSHSFEEYTSTEHKHNGCESDPNKKPSVRRVERRLDDEYAEGNLLLGNFVIVVLVIDILLGYVHYANISTSVSKVLQNMTFSFETSRIAQQILSDDVDCSLLMKEATLEGFNIQRQMLFGVMCLALLVPYSVTPKSSISTMFYYMQKREALANSFRLGHITEECAVTMPPSTCKLRSRYKYMEGYIDLVRGLKNSSLKNVWKIGATKRGKAKNWLFQGGNLNDKGLPLRKFRIPKALKNAMMFYNVSSQYTHIVGSKIVISENVTEKLLNDFIPVKSGTPNVTAALHSEYRFCALPLLPYTKRQRLEVRFPCREDQPTSSIISAFIVRVVREIMLRNNLERGYMDAGFHALLLHAHHYAEQLIAEQQDATALDRSTKLPMLLLESNISLAVTNIPKRERPHLTVMRAIYERVATGIIWRSRSYETILMINLGMNSTNNVPKLLSSAAGLMVIDKVANNAPIIVASASGSLRTVEAVASVILRMLMFDEEPGAAIHANASFYDTEDPGFYCENNDEKFLKEMEKKGISCFPLKQDNFAHMDRIAMAIRQRLPKGRLIAAVDRRARDFNYAVGL